MAGIRIDRFNWYDSSCAYRYVSLDGGTRGLGDLSVVITEGIQQHANQMLAKVGRPLITWVNPS
jgi:hypothetical protein